MYKYVVHSMNEIHICIINKITLPLPRPGSPHVPPPGENHCSTFRVFKMMHLNKSSLLLCFLCSLFSVVNRF